MRRNAYQRWGEQKPKRRTWAMVVAIVGVVCIGAAAWVWIGIQRDYATQDEVNEELAAYATVSNDGETAPEVEWPQLEEVNPDLVGWIQIPGTSVNYPVYQGIDNDYYLHTTATGAESVGGQVFMDCDNTAPGMVDDQTVIYGHHLSNGAMFKPVADMIYQETFDSVDTIWYTTTTGTYELEPLLLAYNTYADDGNARRTSFTSNAELRAYLDELLDRAVTSRADAGSIISSTDHVLSLCTCCYVGGYDRTILVCVPKDEAGTTEPSKG